MKRKARLVIVLLLVLYLMVGAWFHVQWKRHTSMCRELHAARGEFVEQEVFSPVVGWFFDETFWPVYMWANKYNFGSIYGKPCKVRVRK